MLSTLLLLGGLALANAQAPPAPVLLTAEKSGVLPVLPTPFAGVETLEGAIIDAGPVNPGFTGVYGNASVQQNAAGVVYQAVLPDTNFDPLTGSTITGYINTTVPSNGTGVMITVDFRGFPGEARYGPFVYHIHGTPVPADGNCTSTLGHLDTTNRGELYACDPAHPETCQVGDLSGKHGNITSNSFRASYHELYLSTNPQNSYYFGFGSIVIHSTNTTRLTCANFTLLSNGTSNYNFTIATTSTAATSSSATITGSSSPGPVASATTSPSVSAGGTSLGATAVPTGGAARAFVGGLVGAAAFVVGAVVV